MNKTVQIALVEDSASVRRQFVETLNSHDGWRVTVECSNVAAALREIPAHFPDLILLDILLFQSSGIDLIFPLRQALPQAPIVMVTVSENASHIREAIKAGACGYITKTNAADLILSIEDVLAGRAPVMSPSVARHLWLMAKEKPLSMTPEVAQLSPRESQVLDLSMRGQQQGEIALALNVSLNTVKTHRRRIYEKLGVGSIMEAAEKARGGREQPSKGDKNKSPALPP